MSQKKEISKLILSKCKKKNSKEFMSSRYNDFLNNFLFYTN